MSRGLVVAPRRPPVGVGTPPVLRSTTVVGVVDDKGEFPTDVVGGRLGPEPGLGGEVTEVGTPRPPLDPTGFTVVIPLP